MATTRDIHHIHVPEFRPEQLFMKKANRYIKFRRPNKDSKEEGAGEEVLNIQWLPIIWFTFLDQICMPTLSGIGL